MDKDKENKKYNFEYSPSIEYRFFLNDSEGEGVIFFRSSEDRDLYTKDIISDYFDDGWDEGSLIYFCAGEVTHTAQKTNIKKRPPAEKLNENGEDENGFYWDEFGMSYNFELLPISIEKINPESTKFISILEKQPKINERILGVTSGGDLFIDIYGPIIYDILTYWMPLPMSVE